MTDTSKCAIGIVLLGIVMLIAGKSYSTARESNVLRARAIIQGLPGSGESQGP